MVTMGKVWDRTTEFLSANIGAVLPIALLAIFVPVSIQRNIAPLMSIGSPGARIGIGLVSLLLSLTTLWGQLAIISLAIDPAIGSGGAAVSATRRFLPVLGITLLLGIALGVLVIPIFIVLGMSGVDLASLASGVFVPLPSHGASLFLILYGLVLLVFCVLLGVRLVVMTSVIVAERRGLGAIGRAFALTRGLALRIFGVLVLYAIVAAVSLLAVKTVFGSILQLVAGGDKPITVATVITAILVAAVSAAFTVLATSFIAKLYLAAREARDTAAEPI